MKIEFYISGKETKHVKNIIAKVSGANKGLGTLHVLAVFFSSFFIMFSLVQIIPNIEKVYNVFPVFIICLGVLFIGIIIYFLNKWYVGKKIIEKNGLSKAKLTYEILPDKIIVLTDGGLKQELLPSEIIKFVEAKGFLLMFVRKNVAFYISPNAFSSETHRTECKNKINALVNNN